MVAGCGGCVCANKLPWPGRDKRPPPWTLFPCGRAGKRTENLRTRTMLGGTLTLARASEARLVRATARERQRRLHGGGWNGLGGGTDEEMRELCHVITTRAFYENHHGLRAVVGGCGVSRPAGRCHPAGQEILAVASPNATPWRRGRRLHGQHWRCRRHGVEGMDGMSWDGNGDERDTAHPSHQPRRRMPNNACG